jgi:hypothetical protein
MAFRFTASIPLRGVFLTDRYHRDTDDSTVEKGRDMIQIRCRESGIGGGIGESLSFTFFSLQLTTVQG